MTSSLIGTMLVEKPRVDAECKFINVQTIGQLNTEMPKIIKAAKAAGMEVEDYIDQLKEFATLIN